jgi:hypothetical protein
VYRGAKPEYEMHEKSLSIPYANEGAIARLIGKLTPEVTVEVAERWSIAQPAAIDLSFSFIAILFEISAAVAHKFRENVSKSY